MINDNGWINLSIWIKQFKKIKKIRLYDNIISEKGIFSIITNWKSNLLKLYFSYDKFNEDQIF